MRRYVITLFIIAFVVGSLFQASDTTGIHILKMFGVVGIFMMGVIGTLALSRWQSRQAMREIESALKSLEPEFVITDWAYNRKGRPDYVLVGPGCLVALCLEDVAHTAGAQSAESKVARGRVRVQEAVKWVKDRLDQAAPELRSPLGGVVRDVPVGAALVLTRRKAEPSYSTDDVAVLNADQVPGYVLGLSELQLLGQSERIKVTRLFREA